MKKGLLIALEGPDGTWKKHSNKDALRLFRENKKNYESSLLTREPGGGRQ